MGERIRRQNLSAEEMRWRMEYLAGWSLAVFLNFVQYYEKVLAELCTSAEKLGVWKGALLAAEMQSHDAVSATATESSARRRSRRH